METLGSGRRRAALTQYALMSARVWVEEEEEVASVGVHP